MILKTAKNPQWSDSSGTRIDLIIIWQEFEKELPFIADANDFEEHGKLLFTKALNGDFGVIAPFIIKT